MKRVKLKLNRVALIFSLTFLLLGLITPTITQAKDEDWSAPVFAYGWSLTPEQKAEVEEALGITNKQGKLLMTDYREISVTGEDLVKFVPNKGFDAQSKAWSSALIIPLKPGSGVGVKIMTPDKITGYTEAQYRQASLDSGIFDAEIRIASPKILDGSGAFSGIRKAYEDENPATTPEEAQARQENYAMSQQNMEDLASLAQEQSGNEQYDDNAVNIALAEVKQEISDQLQTNDTTLSEDQLEEMINEALTRQKIYDVLSTQQIQTYLVPILNRYQQAPVARDQRAKEAWNTYTQQIKAGTNDLAQKFSKLDLGNFAESTKESSKNLFQKIGAWFTSLLNKLTGRTESVDSQTQEPLYE